MLILILIKQQTWHWHCQRRHSRSCHCLPSLWSRSLMLAGRGGQRSANHTVSRGLSTPNVSHVPWSVSHAALNPKPLATPTTLTKISDCLHHDSGFYKAITVLRNQILLLHIKSNLQFQNMDFERLFSWNGRAWWNSTNSGVISHLQCIEWLHPFALRFPKTWACGQSVLRYRILWFKPFEILF